MIKVSWTQNVVSSRATAQWNKMPSKVWLSMDCISAGSPVHLSALGSLEQTSGPTEGVAMASPPPLPTVSSSSPSSSKRDAIGFQAQLSPLHNTWGIFLRQSHLYWTLPWALTPKPAAALAFPQLASHSTWSWFWNQSSRNNDLWLGALCLRAPYPTVNSTYFKKIYKMGVWGWGWAGSNGILPGPSLSHSGSWAPKSLQTVTAAMKLKDTCSLEGKLR